MNQITVNVVVGSPDTITVSGALLIQAGSQNVTFMCTGNYAAGQPITLSGNLEGQWAEPFGLKWMTVTTATLTVQLGSQPQITIQGGSSLSFAPGVTADFGLGIGAQGFAFSFTGVPVSSVPALVTAVSGGNPNPVVGDVSVLTAGLVVRKNYKVFIWKNRHSKTFPPPRYVTTTLEFTARESL